MTNAATPSVTSVPLGDICESRTNPRKTFANIEDLAASIKTHGVIQPIVLRRLPADRATPYELVAGARRLRASKIAGLDAIPAIIHEDLDDKTAAELQLIENCQREDVHPLEEADGFRALIEKHGYTIDDVAAKVGKGKNFIRSRLTLCSLCEAARDAFLTQKLSPAVAFVIARIPDPELQAKATEEILRSPYLNNPTQAKDHVLMHFMLRLKEAPFDLKDAKLLPEAGSCAACPHRTGNQKELFSDVQNNDLCTNPPCYKKKKDLDARAFRAEQKEKGRTVVSPAKVFGWDGSILGYCDYVELKAKIPDDPQERTWKTILPKDAPLCVCKHPKTGKLHILVEKTVVDAAAKKAKLKIKIARPSSSGGGGWDPVAWKKEQEERQRQHQIDQRIIEDLMRQVTQAIEHKPLDLDPLLRLVLSILLESHAGDTASRRLGPDADVVQLIEAARNMSVAQRQALLIEVALESVDALNTSNFPDELLKAVAKEFGVDFTKTKNTVTKLVKKEQADAAKKAAAEAAAANTTNPPTAANGAENAQDDGEDLPEAEDAAA